MPREIRSELKFADWHYKFVFWELWHNEESAKKFAWYIAPGNHKAFAISQYWEKQSLSAGPSFVGYSEKSIEEAKNKSLNYCRATAKRTKYLFTGYVDPNLCKVHVSYISDYPKKTEYMIKAELEQLQWKSDIEKYSPRCKKLGLKENSSQMNECIVEFTKSEKKINTQNSNISVKDVILTLLVLDKALSRPTVVNRKTNCFFNSVAFQSTGGKGFITCN